MIELENFEDAEPSGISYGGHSGSKKGIIYNNEKWFLKYPKSIKSMDVIGMGYTTSPISEYLGSQIYKLLGLDVHETKLGFANGKIVVLCKDFLNKNETILDYNSIKNDYNKTVETEIEKLHSQNKESDLDAVLIVMNNNTYFKKVPELKNRFWDMFVIDALINNNDRNYNNWGLILNKDTMELRTPPVYANGASFYSKLSDERIELILKEEFKIKQVIYDSCVSSFYKNDKIINPLKYIESMKNEDCNQALIKIYPKIDLNKIKELFDKIPKEYNNISVLSEQQRKLYYKSLEYKYEKVFKPIYNKLINKYDWN